MPFYIMFLSSIHICSIIKMSNSRRQPQANIARNRLGQEEVQPAFRVTGLNHDWEGFIDRMLGEAVQSQEWQTLKGKGRRLDLDNPAGVPAEQVLGNKIMRDNDVAPVWIEDRKSLQRQIERWRRELHHRIQTQGTAALQDERLQARLSQEIVDLNRSIRETNIAIPIFRLELATLELSAEIRRAQKPWAPL